MVYFNAKMIYATKQSKQLMIQYFIQIEKKILSMVEVDQIGVFLDKEYGVCLYLFLLIKKQKNH